MGKVFRLHQGSATIKDWGVSSSYGDDAINHIVDPNGEYSKKEITSIPSPFARIDLVKTAFKKVVDSGDLEGDTIYHKLVSDCLDVGQIFFDIDKLHDKVQIIVWDKENEMNKLTNSVNSRHRILGEAYRLFLDQDKDAYNFDKIERLYLLNYIGTDRPGMMNIIGATSPSTMFFTPANDLSYVSKHIHFGSSAPFDGSFLPLYKRDINYQKWWYAISKYISDFSDLFEVLNAYLTKSYEKASDSEKSQLSALSTNSYNDDYAPLTVHTEANSVEVLGFSLRKKKSNSDQIEAVSGFVIEASVPVNGSKPLVLPVDTYGNPVIYVQTQWSRDTKVPYNDPRALNERTLPVDGTLYPYLTIGDFLEDNIIKTNYQFNKSGFFDGNDNKSDFKDGYLLPLKKEYFNYFTTKDLKKVDTDAHKCFELVRIAGGVKAILRIPIKNGEYITYERIYYDFSQPDRDRNKGGVVEREFTLGIYPNVKYPVGITPYYRVVLLDRETVSGANLDNSYSLAFCSGSKVIEQSEPIRRNRNVDNRLIEDRRVDSQTYAIDEAFDYIELTERNIHAIIIPELIQKTGSKEFTFAIDFGTTNTYIEYSVDKEHPKSFDVTEVDVQMQKLHTGYDNAIESCFNADFVPELINKDTRCCFPCRTVLSESTNSEWKHRVVPMANTNIPFVYEKDILPEYNKMSTNLKWSNNLDGQKRVEHYIECLFLMLRNKVMLNNGDVSSTKIVWFYPASMTTQRYQNFKQIWENLYGKIFNGKIDLITSMSESLAPYYFHKNVSGASSDNVVSIDIGGETSDVIIVKDGVPKYLTSFRFATNAIFGDGYSYNSNSNGFVHGFKGEIEAILTNIKDLRTLCEVLGRIEKVKSSPNIIAFFFSLASNKDLIDKKIEIDFNRMLCNDDKGKYVIILFYTAIMYHIAQMMKQKGVEMPRHITFSGMGSKVLNILTPDNRTLEDYTKLIFTSIYGEEYPTDGLGIIRPENPKEATCQGGIVQLNSHEGTAPEYRSVKEMKTVLMGSDDHTFVTDHEYDSVNPDGVAAEYKKFIEFAFSLDKIFSFHDNFGVNRDLKDVAKAECFKDVNKFIKEGIAKKTAEIKSTGADVKIEETLFFYPLVGVLHALAKKLYIDKN